MVFSPLFDFFQFCFYSFVSADAHKKMHKVSSRDSCLLRGSYKTWTLARASCYQHPLKSLSSKCPCWCQGCLCNVGSVPRYSRILFTTGIITSVRSGEPLACWVWESFLKRILSTACLHKVTFWGACLQSCPCLLPVLSPSGSTADQGNSCWHIHAQHRILSCTSSPKISFTTQNVCIPPLLPSHGPGNCKHCPASIPIHHTLTQSCGLWNDLPAVWLTKQQPHQTQLAHNLHQGWKDKFGFFGSLTKQRELNKFPYSEKSEGTWSEEEKSPPEQGTHGLAIHSRSYTSLLLMNKLMNYTRNHRGQRGNIQLQQGNCVAMTMINSIRKYQHERSHHTTHFTQHRFHQRAPVLPRDPQFCR